MAARKRSGHPATVKARGWRWRPFTATSRPECGPSDSTVLGMLSALLVQSLANSGLRYAQFAQTNWFRGWRSE